MIHPSAVIDPGARLADNVSVGAFSVIGADVSIGAGTWVGPHVIIEGNTTIGTDNKIFQFSTVGEQPQHVGYRGEPTRLEIGHRNIIRESCTINRGTPVGGGVTRIGDDNFLMAYVHVAHDCQVANHTIFANCASLAGHVEVGDYAVLGGFTLVHQFCRVGAHCITGIGSVCLQDVPPYVVAAGNRARPHGINVKGLKRRGFDERDVLALKRAYKTVYRSGLQLKEALRRVSAAGQSCATVGHFAEFMSQSQRGIIR